MIKTESLNFGYTSRRKVLNNISLRLEEGAYPWIARL